MKEEIHGNHCLGKREPVIFKEEVSVSPKQVEVCGDNLKERKCWKTEQGGETQLKRQLS